MATQTPPSRAQIHAHRLLQRAVASLPVNDRTRERGRVDRIGAAIDVMRGAGFAEALTTWCAQAPAPRGESVASVRAWLDAWSLDPLRHEAIEMASVMASTPPVASTSAAAPVERASRWRVTAMILLLPISIHG
ncbi:hypothetical protein [Gemmatimonas sp.]|uniref:hypothetical protein n=1 Tax=Gemmatimonas sp. TaxID=1962908 RepID=UPI002ED94008